MLPHDSQRGIVTNRARNLQVRDFSGLKFGKITPTDVDAAIEFDGRLFIFIEAKFAGTPILYGQKLFLQRLAGGIDNQPQRYGTAIIADHYSPSDEDINVAQMIVREVWWKNQWLEPKITNSTVLQVVRRMGAYVEKTQGRPLYVRPMAAYVT